MEKNYKFDDLVEIMEKLREKCPWDKEQTHKSIRRNFLEETYEAVEAIDNEDFTLLQEELGDVMLQVVFHSKIASESGKFDIDDVCDGICKKLIYRHPHIFSDIEVKNTEEVLSNWDSLKKVEKNQKTTFDTLNSVAKSLPALIRMEKVYSKAVKEGVETDEIGDICELSKEIEAGKVEKIPEMIYNLTKICKKNNLDLEQNIQEYINEYINLQKK
ncbi:MAG: MazG family protein [Clostridia bacterium]